MSVLRIPYAYLYPLIIMFCIVGVYAVNHVVDVWIMLIMGVVGYLLAQVRLRPRAARARPRDRADPRAELRQSLIMSNGNYMIFLERPIALGLLLVSVGLLLLSAWQAFSRRKDWRASLAEEEAKTERP